MTGLQLVFATPGLILAVVIVALFVGGDWTDEHRR
jgi:ABC-type sulfate transport system permease subunit